MERVRSTAPPRRSSTRSIAEPAPDPLHRQQAPRRRRRRVRREVARRPGRQPPRRSTRTDLPRGRGHRRQRVRDRRSRSPASRSASTGSCGPPAPACRTCSPRSCCTCATGRPGLPHVYFEWSERAPARTSLRFLLAGEGDIPPLTHEILRQAEPDEAPTPGPRRRLTAHQTEQNGGRDDRGAAARHRRPTGLLPAHLWCRLAHGNMDGRLTPVVAPQAEGRQKNAPPTCGAPTASRGQK